MKFSKIFTFFILYSGILPSTIFSSLVSPIIKTEFIFDKAPFASCHSSTIVETESKHIICAWYAGTQEGAEDVNIWSSIFDGNEWSYPKIIAAESKIALWNPVLFCLPNHELLLFYKVGRTPQDWSGYLKRSFNEGKNWTQAEPLPAGILGPVKNKPLLLDDGTMLCGSSVEAWRRWGCWVDITSDYGKTWVKAGPINVERQLYGIIQPTLFWGKNGEVKMLCRSYQLGHICSSTSKDKGKTWSYAKPTFLSNPNSAIDAVNLADGRILLVFNDSKESRYPLNVAISEDGGEQWKNLLTLEDTPGEYSYPSVIQTKDGMVHITYTWNRIRIKHVILNPSHIK